ncbi:lactonase family protein [Sphingomonas sp. IC-11]|uniref:lactonase family protein n=1 Tax=Sphingomonas sp. IC-11 TaxID=2898528 RepID=UPI001E47CCE6|nr:lactonase family protein [Sphingomonas sp. IC-11]MCD2317427.1 lactonase family protein [Sphingomonas sp. IC-11]
MAITRVIAGGYAEQGAEGLRLLQIDGDRFTRNDLVTPIVNVSAGVRIPTSSKWLFVDEAAGCVRLADASDEWRELASVPSGGEGPCHLALDANATRVAAANYDSGTVALFELDAAHHPLTPPVLHQNRGHGPDPDRQESAHAHWVGFGPDGRLYVADLGIDQLLAFRVPGAASPLAEPAPVLRAPPGSGPRQLAFHPRLPIAYLVSELASTLTVLSIDDERFAVGQTLSTLPDDFAGESLGGAIALRPDGRRLYVSNRGHNSVATFALDAKGQATLLGHSSCGGSSPRYLLLLPDQQRLLVAHEEEGGVTLLPVDADGLPQRPADRADVPGAAFLGLVPD